MLDPGKRFALQTILEGTLATGKKIAETLSVAGLTGRMHISSLQHVSVNRHNIREKERGVQLRGSCTLLRGLCDVILCRLNDCEAGVAPLKTTLRKPHNDCP